MSTQVILLERVENLGNMGDVVTVKPGYARNFLLPQKKAMRASKDNIAYFEAQKKHLQAENDKRRKDAEKVAKTIEATKVPMIRAASESGQLFGSVTTRDIAAGLSEATSEKITRAMVSLNDNFKQIGLFPVDIYLHPEVKVEIIVNIARTAEEADIQAETGKALVADQEEAAEQETEQGEAEIAAPDEEALKDVLEDEALEAEKERQAEAEEKAAEDAAKAEEKAAKKAEKDAAKAAAEEAEAAAEAAESKDAEEPEAEEKAAEDA